jgi:hypothetical protein
MRTHFPVVADYYHLAELLGLDDRELQFRAGGLRLHRKAAGKTTAIGAPFCRLVTRTVCEASGALVEPLPYSSPFGGLTVAGGGADATSEPSGGAATIWEENKNEKRETCRSSS